MSCVSELGVVTKLASALVKCLFLLRNSVTQVDKHRFNRASLINVGFHYATSPERRPAPCDYIAMHDVDLLPLNNELPYGYPDPNSVTHVAAPGLHPKYNYPSFIGGILIVSSTIFRFVDGMSNVSRK